MKTIILAAGYGTRLHPLTENTPKPLIKVGGRPLLEYLMEDLDGIPSEETYIISNNKFYPHLTEWSADKDYKVINDGTNNNDDKLGAVGDIHFLIDSLSIDDDLLIVAGDNYLSDSIKGIVEFGQKLNKPVMGIYDVKDLEKIKGFNELRYDEKGVITLFHEKPEVPEKTTTGIALYYFPKWVIPMISEYIACGNNPDQPGRFIQWLYTVTPVHVWEVPGVWFDVGTYESFLEAESYVRRNKMIY